MFFWSSKRCCEEQVDKSTPHAVKTVGFRRRRSMRRRADPKTSRSISPVLGHAEQPPVEVGGSFLHSAGRCYQGARILLARCPSLSQSTLCLRAKLSPPAAACAYLWPALSRAGVTSSMTISGKAITMIRCPRGKDCSRAGEIALRFCQSSCYVSDRLMVYW